jgi:long-subunit fatty acid transport protein
MRAHSLGSRWVVAGCLAAVASLVPRGAQATNALEFPGWGTAALGRGGAWVARADTPIAAGYNPAGLVLQPSGAQIDLHLALYSTCYTRTGPSNDTPTRGPYQEVCNDVKPTPLPLLGANFRVSDDFAIGLSIAPPLVYGELSFPVTAPRQTKGFGAGVSEQPAGQRYQLYSQSGLLLNPTISAAFAITDRVRVGAGFIWGIGSLKLANASMSTASACESTPAGCGQVEEPGNADFRADLAVRDFFVPGVVVGVHASPLDTLDVGLAVRAQDSLRAKGDLDVTVGYYDPSGRVAADPTRVSSKPGGADRASMVLANPFQADLGVRYHHPASDSRSKGAYDFLNDDLFDVEFGVSYSRNASHREIGIRFPDNPPIDLGVAAANSSVPADASVPLQLKDSVGFRLGGDVVAVPEVLALRLGAFYEPSVQDARYLNVALMASQRLGLSGGAQLRAGPVDLNVGYLHVFFSELDNGGNGAVRGISGVTYADATPDFKTPYPINGGRLGASANVFSLGAVYRF